LCISVLKVLCGLTVTDRSASFHSSVKGRSRSLKMSPFSRPHTIFYWSAIVSIALYRTIFELLTYLTFTNIVILRFGLWLKVVDNGTIRNIGYGFLFAFHSNYYYYYYYTCIDNARTFSNGIYWISGAGTRWVNLTGTRVTNAGVCEKLRYSEYLSNIAIFRTPLHSSPYGSCRISAKPFTVRKYYNGVASWFTWKVLGPYDMFSRDVHMCDRRQTDRRTFRRWHIPR